jgi:hypothetical protein
MKDSNIPTSAAFLDVIVNSVSRPGDGFGFRVRVPYALKTKHDLVRACNHILLFLIIEQLPL